MKIDDDVPALMNPNSAGEKLKVPAKLLLVCLSLKVSSFGAAGLFWSGEWQNKENFNGEEIVS